MPKALVPVIATLVLCGAATVAMLATNAHAQPEPKKPMLLAQAAPAGNERRPAREFRTSMPGPGQMAAHMKQMCEDGYAREVGAMAYIDARLGDVVADLNRYYAPGVTLADPALGEVRIAMELRPGDTDAFFGALPLVAPVRVAKDKDGAVRVERDR